MKNHKKHLYIALTIIFFVLASIIITFQYNPQLANTYIATFTIVLAVATGFLAYFTYLSVSNSYKIQNQERKERLLNEIIEWAENIYKCRLNMNNSIVSSSSVAQVRLYFIADIRDDLFSFQSMQVRGVYIKQISNIFGKQIIIPVNTLADELIEHIEILKTHFGVFQGLLKTQLNDIQVKTIEEESVKTVGDHRIKLNNSANKVIEEATKIKTEIIN